MKPENVLDKVPQDTKARWPNADINYLILDNGNFVVFIDSDIDVDWETSTAYDENGPKDPKRHNDILNPRARRPRMRGVEHRRGVKHGIA